MLSETTGERIARLRDRRRWTQAQLSEATDGAVSEAWIAAVERGRIKDPRREMLEPLAAALEVPLSYLSSPAGWVPVEDSPKDALSAAEAAVLSEPGLSDERRQAALVVLRDLFARGREQAG